MKKENSLLKTKKLVLLSIFAAAIIALQFVSAYVKVGPFSVTLVLVPIVLGGAFLGVSSGAILGAFFGIFTFVFCVIGIDPGGNMMFAARPFMTFVVCVLKGTMSGVVSAYVFKCLRAKKVKAVVVKGNGDESDDNVEYTLYRPACSMRTSLILAAFAAPLTNTAIFLIFATTFYKSILEIWAGGTIANMFVYVITALVGVNFVIEAALNVIVCPIVGVTVSKTKWYKKLFSNG